MSLFNFKKRILRLLTTQHSDRYTDLLIKTSVVRFVFEKKIAKVENKHLFKITKRFFNQIYFLEQTDTISKTSSHNL